ncbi:MAG: hypothetical protein N3E37_01770 [Candidatus Micrarchaeota archaeon]|nr:hypothetical protein [Candidatus Micrarchaeota archaeon]
MQETPSEKEKNVTNNQLNQNSNYRNIKSRGIPSSEDFYLPRYDSPELKQFQNEQEIPTRNIWPVELILNFVFPKRYKEKYYEISLKFMKELLNKTCLEGKEIAEFVKNNNYSKATFYNKILIRLKRIGMIKVERKTITINNTKYRPMKVTLSKTFGNYLMKIADSWLVHVDEARAEKHKSE